MELLMYSLLGTFVGCIVIIGVGYLLIRYDEHRHRQAAHHKVCSRYQRCPECLRSEEPMSNLDRWDRFR